VAFSDLDNDSDDPYDTNGVDNVGGGANGDADDNIWITRKTTIFSSSSFFLYLIVVE